MYDVDKSLNKISDITAKINSIYKLLCDLEYKNLINSNKYKELINDLNLYIQFEQDVFSDPKMTENLCIQISKLLLDNLNTDRPDVDFHLDENDNTSTRRILYNLNNKIGYDIDLLRNIGFNNKYSDKELYEQLKRSEEINHYQKRDLINLVLLILNEYISSINYDKLKKELIKIKYSTIFINPLVEKDCLIDNFVLKDYTYTTVNCLIDFYQMDYQLFEIKQSIYFTDLSLFEIEQLIKLSNKDATNLKEIINMIMRLIYLRSSISFLDNDDLNVLKEIFQTLEKTSAQIPIYIIKNILDDSKDKEKIRTIRLFNGI